VRRTELFLAAAFVALGLVTMLVLVPKYVAGSVATEDLSPAFMPYVAAGLGTGAMALLFLIRLRRGGGEGPMPLPARSWAFIGTVAALLVAAFVLMDRFGYLAGAAALVAGFMLMVRASVRVVLGVAIVLPVALWLLFDKLLDFPLP
jgi:Tripartite tricarboxylate transporter TctB family